MRDPTLLAAAFALVAPAGHGQAAPAPKALVTGACSPQRLCELKTFHAASDFRIGGAHALSGGRVIGPHVTVAGAQDTGDCVTTGRVRTRMPGTVELVINGAASARARAALAPQALNT